MFSLTTQLQCIQPNIINDSIRTFINIKQPNTQTQPEESNGRHERHYSHKVYARATEAMQILE